MPTNGLNGWKQAFWRVAGGLTLAAALGAVAYASTRASEDAVKENKSRIEQHENRVDKRLRGVENNVLKVCQLLDRQDRRSGGPGLDCKDPD